MRRNFVLPILLLGLSAIHCSKGDLPANSNGISTTPASTGDYGRLSGYYLPLGSLLTMKAANINTGQVFMQNIDSTNQNFSISSLPMGSYKVSFTASPAFNTPADTTVIITANSQTDLGGITLRLLPGFGTVVGIMAPATSATAGLTSMQNPTPVTINMVPDSVTGKFGSSQIPAGKYSVFFTPDAFHYLGRTGFFITVVPGQTIDLGTIATLRRSLILNFKDDGALVDVPGLQIQLSGTGFQLKGVKMVSMTEVAKLNIVLDGVTGPGTYQVLGTSTSYISYTRLNQPTLTATAGGGSVTISSIDPVSRRITGSFSADVKETASAAVTHLTEGVFEASY